MILETILNLLAIPIKLLISGIPQTAMQIPSSIFEGLSQIFYGVGYVIPIFQFSPLLVFSFTLGMAKISFALLLRIKSFVPTMGD